MKYVVLVDVVCPGPDYWGQEDLTKAELQEQLEEQAYEVQDAIIGVDMEARIQEEVEDRLMFAPGEVQVSVIDARTAPERLINLAKVDPKKLGWR